MFWSKSSTNNHTNSKPQLNEFTFQANFFVAEIPFNYSEFKFTGKQTSSLLLNNNSKLIQTNSVQKGTVDVVVFYL